MSLFDRYGIKEVADVTFYEINEKRPHVPGKPILYLDTLKVSTVEQTAENTDARGGKGNTALMTWDYGKEITINLEDALFSMESLGVMYGSKVEPNGNIKRSCTFTIPKNLTWWDTGSEFLTPNFDMSGLPSGLESNSLVIDGKKILGKVYLTDENGETFDLFNTVLQEDRARVLKSPAFNVTGPTVQLKKGIYIFSVEANVYGQEIDISANTFPGMYYVTGETYARNEKTGKDEFFQLIFPKVKILSESNTLTMEADGDPSVFNMAIKVLKTKGEPMMSLVQYDVDETIWETESYRSQFDGKPNSVHVFNLEIPTGISVEDSVKFISLVTTDQEGANLDIDWDALNVDYYDEDGEWVIKVYAEGYSEIPVADYDVIFQYK